MENKPKNQGYRAIGDYLVYTKAYGMYDKNKVICKIIDYDSMSQRYWCQSVDVCFWINDYQYHAFAEPTTQEVAYLWELFYGH